MFKGHLEETVAHSLKSENMLCMFLDQKLAYVTIIINAKCENKQQHKWEQSKVRDLAHKCLLHSVIYV